MAATHLAVVSSHKHGSREGLDDDRSPADSPVGLAGPLHPVLFLEHYGCTGSPQVLSQPGHSGGRAQVAPGKGTWPAELFMK